LLLASSGAAVAQNQPPYDPAIDVQLFEYAAGPKSFFAVADADTSQKQQLALDVFFTFLTNPFIVYDVDASNDQIEGPRTEVVSSMLTAELGAAYGLTNKLQLGVSLPVVLTMTGDGLDPSTAMPSADGLSVTGLGDLRAELKAQLLRRGELRLAALGGLSLPSSFGSGGSEFLGDDLPTLRGRLALQWTRDRVSLGANAGFVLRKPREIYATEIGQQLTWAAGAALRVTERFFVIGESFGRTGLPSFELERSPVEVEGGLRVFVTSSWAVAAGGGTGLVKGVGSPDLRVFASLGYAPDVRDSDGDGVVNGRDACVLEPEDKDGWEDSDGCPDLDNDGDRRADATDQCPNQAEDIDGFQDEDGCPELDNDGDGLPDLEDKCPMDQEDKRPPFPADGCSSTKYDSDFDELVDAIDACPSDPEDLDGFEDGDGCPDDDNDRDGVADADDQCPLCPEDKDGLGDEDGCPESDVDLDGLADAADKCPMEAEVMNSVEDFDGCPDEGGIVIASYDGERILVDRMPPFDKKGLTAAGVLIVDQIGLTILMHPEVTRWVVALAAPKQREAVRQGRAVEAQLVRRGVPAASLELITAAGSPKIAAVAQERVDPEAPRTCPVAAATPRPERVERKPVPAVAPATPPPPSAPVAPPASARPAPAAPLGPAKGATAPTTPSPATSTPPPKPAAPPAASPPPPSPPSSPPRR
jgi:OmpA-OmpF porin, OOP family